MDKSIFSRIVDGEIPCYKVAEDDFHLAFLDIQPLKRGHTLVIPKQQVDKIFDLPPEDFQKLFAFAYRVGIALEKAISCKRIGIQVIGMEVPHAHIHLIPIDAERDMLFSNPKLKLSADEMESIASTIRSKIA